MVTRTSHAPAAAAAHKATGKDHHEQRSHSCRPARSRHGLSTGNIASYIDHTLLKPEASEADILKVCAEAAEYHFKSVCVNPLWVKTVKTALKGSGVLTCSVIGFPLGATPTDVKTFEARGAVLDGADEIDMVINIAAARAGDKGALVEDISAVAEAVHAGGAILKVIIETSFLTTTRRSSPARPPWKPGRTS